jgi:hypothetical protein
VAMIGSDSTTPVKFASDALLVDTVPFLMIFNVVSLNVLDIQVDNHCLLSAYINYSDSGFQEKIFIRMEINID